MKNQYLVSQMYLAEEEEKKAAPTPPVKPPDSPEAHHRNNRYKIDSLLSPTAD